ncbi:reverse transcriptase domain-containing protein [Nephila pilipes]|uniref:Reverse transcriptase domain-containing protein n=1 Tax=Nephila pilipes TaxID=299642 RepID=A0A8X6USQ3_NEPPI|nr:reverse transcriptase domain-containing protein [Nephila pilipes]
MSPFLLSATIKHHIEKYREQYPAATEMLDTCLYVDDVISGADDISQALKISKDADTIMKDASMKLRKWNSNDQALMKTWEYEGLETYPRHSENDSGVQSSKVLGIPWNVIHDYFTIDVKGLLELDTSKPVTKRIVLQSAGKIYDPVGFLSPYTIKLKCLLQELWLRKLAWDDELPPDIYATWLQWWFIHNCRTRSAKIRGPLTSQEVSYAENWLIRSLHEKEFPEEMRKLLAVIQRLLFSTTVFEVHAELVITMLFRWECFKDLVVGVEKKTSPNSSCFTLLYESVRTICFSECKLRCTRTTMKTAFVADYIL